MEKEASHIRVFKFGGASVKNADSVKNVSKILREQGASNLLVVVSAMGKSTNLLEQMVHCIINGQNWESKLEEFKNFHRKILDKLIDNKLSQFFEVENLFIELECTLDMQFSQKKHDYIYDQIVCYGELVSTRIISQYLSEQGIRNRWIDARSFICTSNKHRCAKVDWEQTEELISKRIGPLTKKQVVVTQGFISRSVSNQNTTLGREGSDYSAAIFAYCLNANKVVIWKDVPGIMNGDPKRMNNAVLLEKISYREAIELAYYGASVIHPKTIQPLQRKQIPLEVRSFLNSTKNGTQIQAFGNAKKVKQPCYIFKEDQALISISTRDLSFIIEDNMSEIFKILSDCGLRVNLMQNTAVSFSLCVNNDTTRIENIIANLSKEYRVEMDNNLELLTVFNPGKEKLYNEYLKNKAILIENSTTNAMQFILQSEK